MEGGQKGSEEKEKRKTWLLSDGMHKGGEFLGDTISVCCVLTNYHLETGVGEEWLLGSHLEDWWTVLKWLSFSNPPSGPAHLCSPLPLNFKTFSEHSTPPQHTQSTESFGVASMYMSLRADSVRRLFPRGKIKKKTKKPQTVPLSAVTG